VIRDEITVKKDPQAIWHILTDIAGWGRWTRVISHAAVYGPLMRGTEFKCIAGKWDFACFIEQIETGRVFACRGKSIGLNLSVNWELTGDAISTRVRASAEFSGWIVRLFGKQIGQSIKDSLFTWLYALKTRAERGEQKSDHSRQSGDLKQHFPRKVSLTNPFNALLRRSRRRRDDSDE